MTRARNTLLLSSLTLIWTTVAVAQPAPPAPQPGTPAEPPVAAPPAPAQAQPSAPKAPAAAAPAAAAPAAPDPAPPVVVPPAANAPAAVAPIPPASAAPAPAATGALETAAPAAPNNEVAPATAAEPAPAEEPRAEERKASFLDPHPPGYIPSIYERDARKHEGFSVRLSVGLGYGSSSRELTRDSYKVSGLLGLLSLDIGTSVIENLIIYGRFSGFAWNSISTSDAPNAGGSYLGLLGAGARYYLMPYNIFGSATLGVAATQVLDDLGNAQNAHPGFGFELEVGHDFWAGTPLDQRAIGLALRFGYVTAGATGTREKDPNAWNSFAISLLFAAAYN